MRRSGSTEGEAAQLQEQVREWLTKLSKLIDDQHIQKESHLEEMVRVRTPDERARQAMLGAGASTLLELLGYVEADVADHKARTIIGTVMYEPDYILQPEGKEIVVLDLKAPDVPLDTDRASHQICTYCEQVKAPLGILFNGKELRVFVNTEYKGLRNFEEFARQPVVLIDRHDLTGMANSLTQLAKSALVADPVQFARKLAKKRRAEENDRRRQHIILDRLNKLLSNPPEVLLAALPGLEGVWDGLEPMPSETEISDAWRTKARNIESTAVSTIRGAVNPKLRQMVAEVCRKKGWEAIERATIRGLRCRPNGPEGHGFRLVPDAPGVPAGLCVQGVDTPTAKSIIAELEKML